jgi:type IV secretory pathway TrbD component
MNERRINPVYSALLERPLFFGVNRFTFMLNLLAAAMFVVLLRWTPWILVFATIQGIMMLWFRRDPFLYEKYVAYSREGDIYLPVRSAMLRQWPRAAERNRGALR